MVPTIQYSGLLILTGSTRILDALHFSLMAHGCYYYLITNFSKPEVLLNSTWWGTQPARRPRVVTNVDHPQEFNGLGVNFGELENWKNSVAMASCWQTFCHQNVNEICIQSCVFTLSVSIRVLWFFEHSVFICRIWSLRQWRRNAPVGVWGWHLRSKDKEQTPLAVYMHDHRKGNNIHRHV